MLISTTFPRGVLGVRGSNPGRDLTKIFSLIFDREMYVIAVLEVTLLLLLFFVMWTLMSKCLDMLLKKISVEVLSKNILRTF